MTKATAVCALLLVFAALGLAGAMDAQDAENSHRGYCEMVELWDSEARQGIATEQRKGWPPYDGRKQCN